MNYYETLFVVHSALDTGRLKDIVVSIQDMISGTNSKICVTDVWGKKKLSYLIDKQNYGTYVLIQFESNGLSNNKIATELEHNPNVLTYLTTKINEEQIDKNPESLDEQLSDKVQEESKSTPEEAKEEESESTPEEVNEQESNNNENSEDDNGTNK